MDGRRVRTLPPAELAHRLRLSPLLRRLARIVEPVTLYLTGGSLRDRLLGIPTADLDLVVEDDAETVAHRLGRELGGTVVPLGTPPAVTWRLAGRRWHVDILGIPRGELRRDVTRRDFTVNAILWRLPAGPLLDLTGGLDDLAAGRLAVIDPRNLHHDPLRVLRGLRLVATRPMLSLTAEAERHLAAARHGLGRVAAERVTAELRLLLGGSGVRRALRIAWRVGVLAVLHPSWRGVEECDQLLAMAERLAGLASSPGFLRQGAEAAALAVLAAPAAGFPQSWDAAAAEAALCAVGFPERAARRAAQAAALGELLAACLGTGDSGGRALAARQLPVLPTALAWAVARRGGGGDEARALLRWAKRFALRPPLLRGDEVAKVLSLPPGPALAAAVQALKEARARGEVRTGRQARRWLEQRVDPAAKPLLE